MTQKKREPKGFKLSYPGVLCFQEFSQALWEDLSECQEGGLKFVKNGNLYLPVVDQHGDPLHFKINTSGGVAQSFGHNGAYQSIASRYVL